MYNSLRTQGLNRLSLWIQNLTLIVGQGLWIQIIILYCSCSKVTSRMVWVDDIDAFCFDDSLLLVIVGQINGRMSS